MVTINIYINICAPTESVGVRIRLPPELRHPSIPRCTEAREDPLPPGDIRWKSTTNASVAALVAAGGGRLRRVGGVGAFSSPGPPGGRPSPSLSSPRSVTLLRVRAALEDPASSSPTTAVRRRRLTRRRRRSATKLTSQPRPLPRRCSTASSPRRRWCRRPRSRGGRGRGSLSSSALLLLPLSDPSDPTLPPTAASSRTRPLFRTSAPAAPATAAATTWKERLVDVSNLASLLCVLDCTLLPLVSVAILALSRGAELVALAAGLAGAGGARPIAAGLSSFLAYLPALSHGIALYFIIVNYLFSHCEARFSLELIYATNSHTGVGMASVDAWLCSVGVASATGGHDGHAHDACGAVVGAATGMMAHTCPKGLAHRAMNTLKCALILGSNYLSRKHAEERSRGCVASALAEAWDGGGQERA
ncbi:hypothetical protein ACHAWF_006469, partial [Thalassiosira exigua]